MSKKIIIADYLGNSDRDGTISGHLLKVLRELDGLLRGDFELSYAVCENYAKELNGCNVVLKLQRISIHYSKMKEVLQRVTNIREILKKGDRIWFVNIDPWFFPILLICNTRRKRIYITNYLNYKNIGQKKRKLYEKASKKIFCEFTTVKDTWNKNQVFIPDYWFEETFYEGYIAKTKKKQAVFCGTISRAKEVIGLINSFRENGQPLIIKGKFESKELYLEAIQAAGNASNIIIENGRLSDSEYYSLIGESEFVVLPYKKENYSGRSSGVILEGIFMGATIIAPNFLLTELDVSGIGYENISELETLNMSRLSEKDIGAFRKANETIKQTYSKQRIEHLYFSKLNEDDK